MEKLQLKNEREHRTKRGKVYIMGEHDEYGTVMIVDECKGSGPTPFAAAARDFFNKFPEINTIIIEGRIFRKDQVLGMSKAKAYKIAKEKVLSNFPVKGLSKQEIRKKFRTEMKAAIEPQNITEHRNNLLELYGSIETKKKNSELKEKVKAGEKKLKRSKNEDGSDFLSGN